MFSQKNKYFNDLFNSSRCNFNPGRGSRENVLPFNIIQKIIKINISYFFLSASIFSYSNISFLKRDINIYFTENSCSKWRMLY